jgi:3D (Asp-Asp-Asp) domain-containing protein
LVQILPLGICPGQHVTTILGIKFKEQAQVAVENIYIIPTGMVVYIERYTPAKAI